ncbi:MAG: flagellar basal-body rod protein FlgG [Planctomycetes bacterium]|nr:flagellar basal-body rod protein FlgG [Planctomycetota bacterium]
MIKALYTAATGMKAQQMRIDVIANNLANVNTTGFKRSNVNFEDLLYSTLRNPNERTQNGVRPSGLQIGTGSRLVNTSKVFTPGSLEETGNPLDLVITGSGFFQLQDISGSTVYSRDGNFMVDRDGSVVNSQGLKLIPNISLQPNAKVAVGVDGVVTQVVGDTSSQVGQIQLASFTNPAGLEAIGGNIFRKSEASGEAVTGTPGAAGYGGLVGGFLESSNVEVVNELVGLITSQRAYETSSRAISAADEMLTTVNQIVR